MTFQHRPTLCSITHWSLTFRDMITNNMNDMNSYYRTPTGVIDHETCADNFLYRPKRVLRLRIIYVILTHCSLNICRRNRHSSSARPVSGDAYRSEPLSTKNQCHMHILLPSSMSSNTVFINSHHSIN